MLSILGIPLTLLGLVFGALPASNNYKLQGYGLGSGGTAGSTAGTKQLEAITGEISASQLAGTTYRLNPGFIEAQQANVPPAPTWTNTNSYYNKLHLTINNASNPSDAKFVVAISTDDFVTTNYVQSDNTVGASLGSEDYQTYVSWGGASGVDVIGLSPSTTYKVKAKAMHGNFSETGYGPTASAATVAPQLSFDIDVAATDSESAPPYSIGLGSLLAGTVASSTDKIWFDFATNAANGGKIYIYSLNGGLNSAAKSYTISSASADLDVSTEGFGAQSSSATQSAGGPISAVSPYDVSGNNVGVISSTIREIYSTANAITAGRASFLLKAKAKNITPAATDYAETITAIASGNY